MLGQCLTFFTSDRVAGRSECALKVQDGGVVSLILTSLTSQLFRNQEFTGKFQIIALKG